MPRCLLFDLFGTLVEYEDRRRAHDFEATFSYVSGFVEGVSYESFVQTIETCFVAREQATSLSGVEFTMAQLGADVAERLSVERNTGFVDGFVRRYMREWGARVKPVTGVTGLLTRLSAHYRLGLISNTHYPPLVYELLERMAIKDLLELVCLSADVGRAKPDAGIFQTALQALKLDASEVVYVGDNYEHDYRGASGVGIDCYLIGKHARVPRDRQLRSILDLSIHFNTAR